MRDRQLFGNHRQAGMSRRKRARLQRGREERGLVPVKVERIPYDTAIAHAVQAALTSQLAANGGRVKRIKVHARIVQHTERIPSRDTWSVLDAETEELLGTYSTGSAANKASAYFANWGHQTLVRRILPA